MTSERRATLWLVLTTCIWGSTFFTMQLSAEAIASVARPEAHRLVPLVFLGLRFSIAAIAFVIVMPRIVGRMTLDVWLRSLGLAVAFFAGFVLQLWSLQRTTPTVTAFLTNMTVIFTPVLGALVFRERGLGPLAAGAAIAACGIWVMTNPRGGDFGAGELYALLCSVAFAVQIQLTNVVTAKSDPEGITLGMFVWAVVFSVAGLALFEAGRPMLAPSFVAEVMSLPKAAWTIVFNALAASVVAIWVMNRFQRDVPATRAAVIYTLEPVFAAVFSAAFIAEPMTARKIAGGAIIIAGNAVCEVVMRVRSASSSRLGTLDSGLATPPVAPERGPSRPE
jgi:drug/metabolite transporter (DMT)-like permease